MNIEDLRPDFVARNYDALVAQGVEIPDHLKPQDPDAAAKREAKLESVLQNDVEQWLRLRGYYRRSPSDMCLLEKAPRGWQVHIHKAKRNPILLDILLLGNDGRYLEFELKIPPIRYNGDEQRSLCEHYHKPVITTLSAAIELVKRWEGEG